MNSVSASVSLPYSSALTGAVLKRTAVINAAADFPIMVDFFLRSSFQSNLWALSVKGDGLISDVTERQRLLTGVNVNVDAKSANVDKTAAYKAKRDILFSTRWVCFVE